MYEDASLYSKHSQDHQNEVKRMLNTYGHNLTWTNQDEIVLDIGCGSGDVTNNILKSYLQPSFKALVGIDISEKMIQFCKESLQEDSRVHYHVLDISKASEIFKLPDDLRQYDKIFSFFCLHWVSDRRAVAENLYNLLKPGGEAFLLLVVYSKIYKIWDTIAKSTKWKPFFKGIKVPLNEYIYMDSPDEILCKVFRNSGLIVKESILEFRKNIFITPETDEDLAERIRTVDPLVSHVPDHLKDEYINDALQLTKKDVSPKGATDYNALIVILNKPI